MDRNTFIEFLKTFADNPEAIDLSRSEVIIEAHGQLIELEAFPKNGQIHVRDGGLEQTAERWISRRLANLELLARRIIDITQPTSELIRPSGKFIDVLEKSPEGIESQCPDVISKLEEEITQGSGLSTYVIYLTSDAGEGKTTVVREFARTQAMKYIEGQSESLIVPIYLGGQPFIKLDDMIIGSIANTYKFRSLYIDSFLELTKMGSIIPAFDGFEEMFVVGSSGEAVSSLGNFVQNLGSMGKAIVSARTAYFEIRDFSAQARLFDSLNDGAVSFSRLKLDRWNKEQFIQYWDMRCLTDGPEVWETLVDKFKSEKHPLLTRAVLVKRLADIAEDADMFENLIQRVGHNASSYFSTLVDSIIERELDKWLDRREQSIRTPLLTVEQHHELLAEIAIEMSTSSKAEISIEELNALSELYCSDKGLSPNITRQVVARLPDHPLLKRSQGAKKSLSFDHEEFKDFFTGESLGNIILEESAANFKSLTRATNITNSAVESCFDFLRRCSSEDSILESISFVQANIEGEDPSSNIREVGSAIISRLITLKHKEAEVIITNATFQPEAFRAVSLENIRFEKCYYYRLDLSSSTLNRVKFSNCEIIALEWDSKTQVLDTTMSEDCHTHEVYDSESDSTFFDPNSVSRKLFQLGFDVKKPEGEQVDFLEDSSVQDEDLVILERALRAFQRGNGVSEPVFKVRLGLNYPKFRDHILPTLLETGIFEMQELRGHSHNEGFYILKIKMSEIESAMIRAKGALKAS